MRINQLLFSGLLFCLILGSAGESFAQTSVILGQDTSKRVITPTVQFLAIAPDARHTAMGDVGVATSADVNATYWNAAKLTFIEDRFGFSFSYSPWLANLVNDMFLANLNGYYRLDDRQAVAASLRFFNLGDIQFTDENGAPIRDFNPYEMAFDGTYSRKLGERIGLAITGRFIYSNLSANLTLISGQESKPGISGAVDLGFFYENTDIEIAARPSRLAFGANISNIGAKISYSDDNQQDFIPTNLRLGGAIGTSLDPLDRNSLTLALDFNKLLVPTPPLRDSNGNIIEGTDPRDKTVLSGIFGSFSDAPDGFSEELQEITTSIGLEYVYKGQDGREVFAARIGYFNEHENKGNRKFFTVGAGFDYKTLGLDISYLIPQNQQSNSPLAETLRFTLLLNFAGSDAGVNLGD